MNEWAIVIGGILVGLNFGAFAVIGIEEWLERRGGCRCCGKACKCREFPR